MNNTQTPRTSLHEAIDGLGGINHEGAYECATDLITNGADVDARNNEGETPLHVAARMDSRHRIAAQLIEQGADVNATNNNGVTPLHIAARENASNIAELLIGNGADVNARNNVGETPLDVAEEGEEVMSILQAHL